MSTRQNNFRHTTQETDKQIYNMKRSKHLAECHCWRSQLKSFPPRKDRVPKLESFSTATSWSLAQGCLYTYVRVCEKLTLFWICLLILMLTRRDSRQCIFLYGLFSSVQFKMVSMHSGKFFCFMEFNVPPTPKSIIMEMGTDIPGGGGGGGYT